MIGNGRTHGMTDSSEHNAWMSMKQRCCNKRNQRYGDYGGRGIKICKRLGDFINFYEDMGEKPAPGYEIDRIDNNGDYEPDNCRWTTSIVNNRNNRQSKWWYVNGTRYESRLHAGEILGVHMETIKKWCNGYTSRGKSYPPKPGCYSILKYENT